VPAVAVIRKGLASFILNGCKGYVGGIINVILKKIKIIL
jgi:hypothetical protein